ncbi:unnamed protein product, partial [Mesorhabditis spiculigera]
MLLPPLISILLYTLADSKPFGEPAEQEKPAKTVREAQVSAHRHDELVEEEEGVLRRRADVPGVAIESLDSPIERIEIRLIDENGTQSHADEVIVVDDHEEKDEGKTTLTTMSSESSATESPTEPPTRVAEKEPDYKKVEYIKAPEVRIEETVQPETVEEMAESTSTTMEMITEVPTTPEAEAAGVELRNEDFSPTLAYPSVPPPPAEIDELTKDVDKIPVLKTIPETEENEPEPVEECLTNRLSLPEKVVEKLEEMSNNLRKRIQRLNRQQQRHCVGGSQDERDSHKHCPLWRDEKMVHYYRLMRLNYCSDVDKWPNSNRFKRTYAQHFQLYETLYAFNQQ